MIRSDSIHIPIACWSAWSPGLQSPEAWRNWSGDLGAIRPGPRPDVNFLPPMFRRRISTVSRTALRVAYDCVGTEGARKCGSVFASRYGEQEMTLQLLNSIVAGVPLSPTHFSVSVHNVASGLFSIANKNHHSSTAVAAMENTFSMGMLEAACQWLRKPDQPVLFVMSDEPTPDLYQQYISAPPLLYGLALLLDQSEHARTLPLSAFTNLSGNNGCDPLPPALSFLHTFLQTEEPQAGDLAGRGILNFTRTTPP